MTYPEDIMQAAREAVAATYNSGCTHEIYAGAWDDYGMVQAAAKAIAAERARHQWQPIETAPKDGTHILIKPVRPFNPICEAFWVDDDGGYWSDGFASCVDADVSHWMPLLPPQEATK